LQALLQLVQKGFRVVWLRRNQATLRQTCRRNDWVIGRWEFESGQLFGGTPFDKLTFAPVRYTTERSYFPHIQQHRPLWIHVADFDKGLRLLHVNAEFFVEFTLQTLQGRFAGFDFAAGELPFAALMLVGRALR
jgi:hypothetical protein